MRPLRSLAVALALLAGGPLSHADSGFTVSPVRMDLAPGARATSVSVTNQSDRARTVQVEAFRWTQVDGDDRFGPPGDLVVNPPVFRMAPGATQIVRAGFRNGAAATAEENAWRLYFQEIADDSQPEASGNLRMLLRIGIPLFVAAQGPARDHAVWDQSRAADGSAQVRLTNAGNRHVRIAQVRVRDGATIDREVSGLAYLLPGQVRVWTLKDVTARPLRLVAQSETGAVDVALAPH